MTKLKDVLCENIDIHQIGLGTTTVEDLIDAIDSRFMSLGKPLTNLRVSRPYKSKVLVLYDCAVHGSIPLIACYLWINKPTKLHSEWVVDVYGDQWFSVCSVDREALTASELFNIGKLLLKKVSVM